MKVSLAESSGVTAGARIEVAYSEVIMRAIVAAALLLVLVPALAAAQEPPPLPDPQTLQPAPTVVYYVPYVVPYVVFVPVVRVHGGHHFAQQRSLTPLPSQGMFVAAPATGIFAASPATGMFAAPPSAPRR